MSPRRCAISSLFDDHSSTGARPRGPDTRQAVAASRSAVATVIARRRCHSPCMSAELPKITTHGFQRQCSVCCGRRRQRSQVPRPFPWRYVSCGSVLALDGRMACLVERNGGISPTSSRRSLQGEKSPCRACDGCAGCSALGIGSCADGRLRARVKLIMRCCVDPQLPGKYGCGRHPAAQRNVALQRECVLLHFSRQGRHGPGARRLWRGVNVIAVAGSVDATPIRAWPHICGLFLGEGSDRHSEEV